jgi:hypothetical protein
MKNERPFDTPAMHMPGEVELLVPPEILFPGTEASERALIDVLSGLSRDNTLFSVAVPTPLFQGRAISTSRVANRRPCTHYARLMKSTG